MAPSSSSAAPPHDGAGLYRRLVWLTLLRIALVTAMLVALALVVLRREPEDVGTIEQILYGIIAATYGASLVYLILLRRSPPTRHRRLAWVQCAGDVFITTCLVYLSGGAESVVVFMFPLTVVSAAVLLYRRGAIAAALLSSLALVAVAIGLNNGWLPPSTPSLAPVPLAPARLIFVIFANVAAIFLSAALASYLAEQLRAARERLTVRERDYLALEMLHECIVRSIETGLVAANRFGRISFLNRAGELISGLSAGGVLGEPLERVFPQLEGKLAPVPAHQRLEVEHVRPSGERRRLGLTVSPLRDGSGANQGTVVAFEDLTELRAMEQTVKRSERLAALGSLAAGLAHELRNPLASMGGSIQLLSQSRVFSQDDQRLMSIVLREADRLNALVSDILQFARPGPGSVEPVALEEIIGTTSILFRNDPTRRGIELALEVEGPLRVGGDPRQLGQVLWNLVSNAADAMPDGGTVRIAARAREGMAVLSVSDQGRGIDPKDLPHIFEPFYTTKATGTGLGLAIVHSIVTGHGGQIDVECAPSGGSTFSVMLPLERTGAGEAQAARGGS